MTVNVNDAPPPINGFSILSKQISSQCRTYTVTFHSFLGSMVPSTLESQSSAQWSIQSKRYPQLIQTVQFSDGKSKYHTESDGSCRLFWFHEFCKVHLQPTPTQSDSSLTLCATGQACSPLEVPRGLWDVALGKYWMNAAYILWAFMNLWAVWIVWIVWECHMSMSIECVTAFQNSFCCLMSCGGGRMEGHWLFQIIQERNSAQWTQSRAAANQ